MRKIRDMPRLTAAGMTSRKIAASRVPHSETDGPKSRALHEEDGLAKAVWVFVCAMALVDTSYAQVVPLVPDNWTIRYSPKMPPSPQAVTGGGWVFSFPVAVPGACPAPVFGAEFNISTCPHVDYVTTPYTKSITGSSISMTLYISTSPTVTFGYHTAADNTCIYPARVRFLIEHTGDAGLYQPYYRWWSNTIAYQLQATKGVTMTAPLTPEQWTSVFGENGNASPAAQAGFAETLRNAGQIGMTFGGGCFYGHGVNLETGNATFTVTDFRINP